MFDNETEDPKPNSKPPYLFLIPVVLGVLGFIGYQTVRMGTDTSVERSPYAVDTSVAQAVVQNGVITVHASRPSAPHGAAPRRVAMNANAHKAQASPTPASSSPPSAEPSTSPEPKASSTPIPESIVAEKPHHKAHHPSNASDNRIARETVPHIERPIAARLVSSSEQANENATAPPDTDVPLVAHHVAASAATAAPVAAAPAPTAKPVVVAQAPAPAAPQGAGGAAGPINAADRIVDAKMSYAAAPDYPDMARDEGVRGTSVVLVTVDAKGDILHTSIASSSGNGSLDRAALSAARSSQYIAPKIDGKPAIETYRVTYDFAP